jgi:hypothetical protein
MENWIRCNCPYCKNENWISLGNLSDCTKMDVSGCTCWNCTSPFLLASEGDSIYYDESNMEDGLKSPIDKIYLKGIKSISLIDLSEKIEDILDEFESIGDGATMQDSYIVTEKGNPIFFITPYVVLKDVLVKD